MTGIAFLDSAAAQTPSPAAGSDAPMVTKVAPPTGPTSGGSTVHLTGTGFTGATAVQFDGVPASSFSIGPPPDSANSITIDAIAPPHAKGKVSITVTGPTGTSPAVPESTFTYQPVHGRWVTVPARQRFFHTATLLPDGKVLVAGGCVDPQPNGRCNPATATAELYDPAHRSWARTADMGDARIGHLATLLPSGKVLISGGSSTLGQKECSVPGCRVDGPEPAASSAELYDPASGTWSPTGPMAFMQGGGTATLLPTGPASLCGPNCGKVLLVGADAAHVQLYDPASGMWSVTAAPEYPRVASSAVLLRTGKVLVAGHLGGSPTGGPAGGGAAAPAELFDPATATWSPTGNAEPSAAISESLTLLKDGRVLVASSASVSEDTPELFMAELYDPTALPDPTNPAVRGGKWTTIAPPKNPRSFNSATLLPDGTVLVTGGGNSPPAAVAELFDTKEARWTFAPSTVGARGLHPPLPANLPTFTATLLKDGTVLVVGASYRTDTLRTYFPGGISFNKLASADAYGPSAELYMPAAGNGSGPRLVGVGLILVAAGVLAGLVVVMLRRRRAAGAIAAEPAPGPPIQA